LIVGNDPLHGSKKKTRGKKPGSNPLFNAQLGAGGRGQPPTDSRGKEGTGEVLGKSHSAPGDGPKKR